MENKSQIEKGFDALATNLMSFLNPPLLDPSQAPLKLSLDNAFKTLLERFSKHIDEIVDCPDSEMVNVLQSAFAPYANEILTIEKALEYFHCSLYKHHEGVRYLSENHWIIKNDEVLSAIGKRLSYQYNKLNFQR